VFCVIQGFVRAAKHRVNGCLVAGGFCDTETGGHPHAVSRHFDVDIHDRETQALSKDTRPALFGIHQKNHKLLAAHPGRNIAAAHVLGQHGSNRFEHLIANRMPPRIVHPLEMVDIQHDQRHRFVAAPTVLQRTFSQLPKCQAIG
jgi:hypothetical protein